MAKNKKVFKKHKKNHRGKSLLKTISFLFIKIHSWILKKEHLIEKKVVKLEHRIEKKIKKTSKQKRRVSTKTEKKIEVAIPQSAIPSQISIPIERKSIVDILKRIRLDNSVKILVVEDESVLSKVLEEKFEKTNLSVQIADDGEKALIYAKNFKPDIIMLDLGLPKIDGFGVLRELKNNEETKNIPVVVSSNLDSDTDITQALKLGAVDYFVKSTHPINEIVEKVRTILLNGRK